MGQSLCSSGKEASQRDDEGERERERRKRERERERERGERGEASQRGERGKCAIAAVVSPMCVWVRAIQHGYVDGDGWKKETGSRAEQRWVPLSLKIKIKIKKKCDRSDLAAGGGAAAGRARTALLRRSSCLARARTLCSSAIVSLEQFSRRECDKQVTLMRVARTCLVSEAEEGERRAKKQRKRQEARGGWSAGVLFLPLFWKKEKEMERGKKERVTKVDGDR